MMRSCLRLVLGSDGFLWSLLIPSDLVVIVGNLINEEGLTLALRGRHATYLIIGRAWADREVGWLH